MDVPGRPQPVPRLEAQHRPDRPWIAAPTLQSHPDRQPRPHVSIQLCLGAVLGDGQVRATILVEIPDRRPALLAIHLDP